MIYHGYILFNTSRIVLPFIDTLDDTWCQMANDIIRYILANSGLISIWKVGINP